MNCIKIVIFSCLLLLTDNLWAQTNDTGTLYIHVSGIKYNKGAVRALIFDRADGFPGTKENSLQLISQKVNGDSLLLVFEGLNLNKRYAISLYHDKNENKHFDSNFFGIPTEGYGTSNNVNVLRAPTFNEAAFDFKHDGQQLFIKLLHLL